MVSKKEEEKFAKIAKRQAEKIKKSDELSKQERYLFNLVKRANERAKFDAEAMRHIEIFDRAQAQFSIDYRWCNLLIDELKEVQDKRMAISKYDADSKWLDGFADENWDWVNDSLSEEEFAAVFPDIAEDMKYSEYGFDDDDQ